MEKNSDRFLVVLANGDELKREAFSTAEAAKKFIENFPVRLRPSENQGFQIFECFPDELHMKDVTEDFLLEFPAVFAFSLPSFKGGFLGFEPLPYDNDQEALDYGSKHYGEGRAVERPARRNPA